MTTKQLKERTLEWMEQVVKQYEEMGVDQAIIDQLKSKIVNFKRQCTNLETSQRIREKLASISNIED